MVALLLPIQTGKAGDQDLPLPGKESLRIPSPPPKFLGFLQTWMLFAPTEIILETLINVSDFTRWASGDFD